MNVNIGRAELTRGNPQLWRLRLHIGIGRRDGLFHDVFQITRDFHRAFTGHRYGLNRQQIAANRGPS